MDILQGEGDERHGHDHQIQNVEETSAEGSLMQHQSVGDDLNSQNQNVNHLIFFLQLFKTKKGEGAGWEWEESWGWGGVEFKNTQL